MNKINKYSLNQSVFIAIYFRLKSKSQRILFDNLSVMHQ
ncbi:Uncharacterised protein [Pragia fontium]|nr:Uncharacterised protein [Pragia fontium]